MTKFRTNLTKFWNYRNGFANGFEIVVVPLSPPCNGLSVLSLEQAICSDRDLMEFDKRISDVSNDERKHRKKGFRARIFHAQPGCDV